MFLSMEKAELVGETSGEGGVSETDLNVFKVRRVPLPTDLCD